MRKKLPVLLLVLIILLQAFAPVTFAASKNEVQSQTVYFCPSDATSEGAGSAEAKWTNHGYKHFPAKNANWNDVVKSTKSGPAKYKLGTDVEALERKVWHEGTQVTNGKNWKIMEFDDVIGASGGKETKYIRVEESSGTIHGHPITEDEYKKLIK